MILRVPSQYPTISAAVSAASPGDVVLVAPGVYSEQVDVNTNYIRIIAEGKNAIVTGGYPFGFFLNGVNGVEVKGFTVLNTYFCCFWVLWGGYNRLVSNTAIGSQNCSGFHLWGTTGNLLWHSGAIANYYDGILLEGGSTNNWIVDNKVQGNVNGNGIETFLPEDANNALVGNTAVGNYDDGIEDWGENTLVLHNKSFGNDWGYFKPEGDDFVAVENQLNNNHYDGILNDATNGYIAANEITENGESGIDAYYTQYSIIQANEIERNRDSGILIASGSTNNLIYDNDLEDNTPYDIDLGDPNNTVLNNDCETSNPPGLCDNDD